MIGEKDGKSVQIGPMFPRLHVNDHVERGGRRAPPRNKMAICARLNAPSQRVPSGSMIPPASLSHDHCQKMNGLSLFCSSPEASDKARGLNSSCSKQSEYQNWRSASERYKALNSSLPLSLFNPQYNFCHSANSPAKLYPPERVLNGGIIAQRVHRVEKEHGISSERMRNQEHCIREDRREVVRRLVKGTSTEIISGDLQRLSRNPKSLRLEEVEISVISDSSEVDSTPRPDTTPDDVVRVIGLNSFWKIRRTIECQQRILAAQIFELHRLVKVQRLIARSPEMLIQRKATTSRKPSVFPENKLRRKVFPENKKRDFSSINQSIIIKPFSPAPRAAGHQWLVPVRSRTQGLVYKPYLGPGFITPACSQTYMNAHSAEASTSKQEPSTDLSIIPYQKIQNPSNINQGKGKTIDALPLFPTKPMDQDQTRQQNTEVNNVVPHSIIPYQKPQNINPGRERTLDALPLFPTKPMDQDQSTQQKTEVIKVVPHNPRSTSESAARIFRSIQEERKQHN